MRPITIAHHLKCTRGVRPTRMRRARETGGIVVVVVVSAMRFHCRLARRRRPQSHHHHHGPLTLALTHAVRQADNMKSVQPCATHTKLFGVFGAPALARACVCG